VVFSSDNGPHKEGGHDPDFFLSRGPLRGIKRDLYEGGIRVPFLARWPGQVPAGKVSEEVVAFWDLLPTFAEVAGAKAPAGIDGQSVAGAMLGRAQAEHRPLYWEFHEGGFKQAVRWRQWKAVRLGTRRPTELYDLSTDVGERRNVAAEQPDIARKLTELMSSSRVDSPHFPITERV
jgi:arylsulfatase A